jgi:hypothetical protein
MELKGESWGASVGGTLRLQEEMQTVARDSLCAIETCLTQHRAELEEASLPLDACLELAGVAIQRLLSLRSPDLEWQVPEEIVARFPENVQAFLNPQGARQAP